MSIMELGDIPNTTHPEYKEKVLGWKKFRSTYEGGTNFIDDYLTKFSFRESDLDFINRKKITYCPAHAKSAVLTVKDSLFQRFSEITRINGSASYQQAVETNVDHENNSMNGFIGRKILPELLVMGKVGVFIDRQYFDAPLNNLDQKAMIPYLYMYTAESIRSWHYENGSLKRLLLRDTNYSKLDKNGLPDQAVNTYRLIIKHEDHVSITVYDANNSIISTTNLQLTEIPFVIFEINASLLTDIADYQIALLNLASADMAYVLKANFPFYVEQLGDEFPDFMRPASEVLTDEESTDSSGEAAEAKVAKDKTVMIGAAQGRQYPKGSERPSFIHPSSEPLRASMDKQLALQKEIRQLINLAISNITTQRESAESKDRDSIGLEAGLSKIGMELEYGENLIAFFWAAYEGSDDVAIIKYPRKYDLKSDESRRAEAKELREIMPDLPSPTLQRIIAKSIVNILLGHKIDATMINKINTEIDSAVALVTDPDIIKQDHEAGFVSTATASKLRGYPEGEVEQAKKDHAERISRIAVSQTPNMGAARGVDDMEMDGDSADDEKTRSQNPDITDNGAAKTRGRGSKTS